MKRDLLFISYAPHCRRRTKGHIKGKANAIAAKMGISDGKGIASMKRFFNADISGSSPGKNKIT